MRPFGKTVDDAKQKITAAVALAVGAFIMGALALFAVMLNG